MRVWTVPAIGFAIVVCVWVVYQVDRSIADGFGVAGPRLKGRWV